MSMKVDQVVVLDDHEFYVCLNDSQAADIACGFLERRCFVSTSAPAGFECVGSFFMRADGTWSAHIAKASDHIDESDFTVVTEGVERLDAIVALWRARHQAYIGYPSL
jgi:hypothetical protein